MERGVEHVRMRNNHRYGTDCVTDHSEERRAVFWDVHNGLHRQGPGCSEATRRALKLAAPLPTEANVLDVACGPGAQTIDLAQALNAAKITAVDLHKPYVEEANRRAVALGLDQRVTARLGDMRSLQDLSTRYDLVWCESAAYVIGFDNALRSWKSLLRPGGKLALSEVVWLRPDAPEPVRKFWSDYPGMRDVESCRAAVRSSGYGLLGDFVLPEAAWWEYYAPMEERLHRLASKYVGDPMAEGVLQASKDEITLYREYGAYYGYAFFVMGRAD